MYYPTHWLDHVTEFSNIFREEELADGKIKHIPVEGEVLQEGTPMDATRFNNMETGILGNSLSILELIRLSNMFNRDLDSLSGEVGTVTLTNGQNYPFNDSGAIIAMQTPRETLDYFVDTEVISATGGFAGQVNITQKLLNGFRISYTGSASSIQVKFYIRGGVFR